jgi:hypothetical protein
MLQRRSARGTESRSSLCLAFRLSSRSGYWSSSIVGTPASFRRCSSSACAHERKVSVLYIAMYGQTVASFGKTVCQDLGNAQYVPVPALPGSGLSPPEPRARWTRLGIKRPQRTHPGTWLSTKRPLRSPRWLRFCSQAPRSCCKSSWRTDPRRLWTGHWKTTPTTQHDPPVASATR